jgi:hypothetical protein
MIDETNTALYYNTRNIKKRDCTSSDTEMEALHRETSATIENKLGSSIADRFSLYCRYRHGSGNVVQIAVIKLCA